jgi:hypothetical protein
MALCECRLRSVTGPVENLGETARRGHAEAVVLLGRSTGESLPERRSRPALAWEGPEAVGGQPTRKTLFLMPWIRISARAPLYTVDIAGGGARSLGYPRLAGSPSSSGRRHWEGRSSPSASWRVAGRDNLGGWIPAQVLQAGNGPLTEDLRKHTFGKLAGAIGSSHPTAAPGTPEPSSDAQRGAMALCDQPPF